MLTSVRSRLFYAQLLRKLGMGPGFCRDDEVRVLLLVRRTGGLWVPAFAGTTHQTGAAWSARGLRSR
ncbi:hypothetical protein GCM10027318_11920 [Massilia agilis]